jgi:hypothetical protein
VRLKNVAAAEPADRGQVRCTCAIGEDDSRILVSRIWVNLPSIHADLECMVPDPIIIIFGLTVHNFALAIRHVLALVGLA